MPAGGLAGLRVAVVTGDDGGGNVARAVSERLSADGAELVSDPTDLDALILAGASGPDLRATFEWTRIDGERAVRWRRIGGHAIFKQP